MKGRDLHISGLGMDRIKQVGQARDDAIGISGIEKALVKR
jgi:hypothetical protein